MFDNLTGDVDGAFPFPILFYISVIVTIDVEASVQSNCNNFKCLSCFVVFFSRQ